MIIFADSAVEKDCINIYSYGMICVKCGCCSRNPDFRSRIICQIRYYKNRIAECIEFDGWDNDPKWKQIQMRNIQMNIRDYKKKLRTCKQILRTMRK